MIAIDESAQAFHDNPEERMESFKHFVLGFCHKQPFASDVGTEAVT